MAQRFLSIGQAVAIVASLCALCAGEARAEDPEIPASEPTVATPTATNPSPTTPTAVTLGSPLPVTSNADVTVQIVTTRSDFNDVHLRIDYYYRPDRRVTRRFDLEFKPQEEQPVQGVGGRIPAPYPGWYKFVIYATWTTDGSIASPTFGPYEFSRPGY